MVAARRCARFRLMSDVAVVRRGEAKAMARKHLELLPRSWPTF